MKFELLTKYIMQIEEDSHGEWIIDKEGDGTPENPYHFPFVHYSKLIHEFEEDVYAFCEAHPEYDHYNYGKTLEDNGMKWGSSLSSVDVSKLDAKAIIAMIVGAIRAERFCDGALLGFLKDGSILKWLKRLEEIDKES